MLYCVKTTWFSGALAVDPMHLYLASLVVFAMITLAVASRPAFAQTPRVRFQLLLALIAVLVGRAAILSLYLFQQQRAAGLSPRLFEGLEIFSLAGVVWALAGPLPGRRDVVWRWYTWLSVVAGAGLVLLAFLPALPSPWQGHTLLLIALSAPLVVAAEDRLRWQRLLPPATLAAAALLDWLGFTALGQFVTLMGYGSLLYVVYAESTVGLDAGQRRLERLNAEAARLDQERLQIDEVARTTLAALAADESLTEALAVLVRATGSERAVLFALQGKARQEICVAGLFKGGQIQDIPPEAEQGFALADFPLLQATIARQRPRVLDGDTDSGLASIYKIWGENRAGPTLIQPLTAQQRVLGVLLLGNSDSGRPLPAANLRLCQAVEPHLAAVLACRQQYLRLQGRLELRRSELEQILTLVELVDDGVVVSDASGRVVLVNRAAEQLLDRKRAALLGQPIGTIYGDIDSRANVEELAADFSRRNKAIPTYLEREGVVVKGRLIPLRNDRKEWAGIVALLRDVTREVNADRAKSNFVFTISRELRDPLTAVKGYAELMASGATGRMLDQQIYFLEKIRASADRMTELIENSLEATERALDTSSLDIQIIDPLLIINEALRQVLALAESRGVRLMRDVPGELPRLQADPVRFKQVLDNLLSNACRFTPMGGRVTLRAWVQEEGLGASRTRVLIIAVIDTGVGIPTVHQSRIFERFYQVENRLSAEAGGIGMGLAIVKELVEAHGGRVWVESVEGEGSNFQVALPLPFEA